MKELDLQIVEVKKEKTNEDKIKELIEKANMMENQVADRKKKTGTNNS